MNAPNLLATDKRPRLLLVDDDPTNLHVLRQILGEDYRLSFATDGRKALQLAQHQPDLILLDIMMPELDGYAVCRQLKAQADTARIPVRAPVVRARVRNHLSLVKLDELRSTRLQIVQRLGRAAEYRDNETGMHVIRMSHYAKTLALAAGCTDEWADDLLNAAPMHDVGKIGIPDAILLKNGPLTAEEWTVMRRHPQIGAEIIGEHDSQVLQMAYSIALTHHEKWDGTGYPQGLAGEDIPLASRIVAVADVFDALTTERPYKHAWTVDDAMDHIEQQAGAHFDPRLVPLFIGLRPQLEDIRERWKD